VVAPAQALQARDWIHPALREGGMALHRGYALQTYLAQCFGNRADTSTAGRQMPCHYGSRAPNYVTLSSVMTTQLPQAVGTAFAMALRHEAPDRPVCFVALGDGASSEGDFHVAMNFAGVMKPRGLGLPLVVFCQNNQWAISTPVTDQCAAPTLASKAASYGLCGVRVDGNDALAVARVVAEAARRARQGQAPVFVEALTYRMGAHSTSDDPSRYRDETITESWAGRDPLARLEAWLCAVGALDEADIDPWREACDQEVRAAITAMEGIEPPPLESLFDDVWSTPPPHLLAQRRQATQHARNGDAAL
jgi:pyruvate dehydrogenase E1 component alpha subunit/2-oxoisovalerate dehydrogenase E1 component alpha subunit